LSGQFAQTLYLAYRAFIFNSAAGLGQRSSGIQKGSIAIPGPAPPRLPLGRGSTRKELNLKRAESETSRIKNDFSVQAKVNISLQDKENLMDCSGVQERAIRKARRTSPLKQLGRSKLFYLSLVLLASLLALSG
jgi:hypothetical protein